MLNWNYRSNTEEEIILMLKDIEELEGPSKPAAIIRAINMADKYVAYMEENAEKVANGDSVITCDYQNLRFFLSDGNEFMISAKEFIEENKTAISKIIKNKAERMRDRTIPYRRAYEKMLKAFSEIC